MRDVKFTLILALILVVLVIFLFLRRVSATLIPSLAMPMSLVGTFTAMYLLGYNLDNLSLMALILAVGFVVDDAIVMLENIGRHTEMGEGAREASFNGSREISFTVLSMTLSLAAVFIPVLFMGGVVGRLFTKFAVTIGVAVLLSGFVALTLTPMLCSRFLKPASLETRGRLYAMSEKIFAGMLKIYGTGLRWFLTHRFTTILFTAVILAGTFFLFRSLAKRVSPFRRHGADSCCDRGL